MIMKRKLIVIGIGAGNPEYVTIQAINALNRASVLFIPNKETGKESLADVRRDICERYIKNSDHRFVDFKMPRRVRPKSNYSCGINQWRDEVEKVYERLLSEEMNEDDCGAFLVWGDPSLYDSTLRVLENIAKRDECVLEYEVIPGISSVQALAARHKITLNRIGESITITTGRKLAEGFPSNVDRVTVMLDSDNSFKPLDGEIDIHWGAYVGTRDEILMSGKLKDVCKDIERLKETARKKHGWIMDSYILTKPEKTENQDD